MVTRRSMFSLCGSRLEGSIVRPSLMTDACPDPRSRPMTFPFFLQSHYSGPLRSTRYGAVSGIAQSGRLLRRRNAGVDSGLVTAAGISKFQTPISFPRGSGVASVKIVHGGKCGEHLSNMRREVTLCPQRPTATAVTRPVVAQVYWLSWDRR